MASTSIEVGSSPNNGSRSASGDVKQGGRTITGLYIRFDRPLLSPLNLLASPMDVDIEFLVDLEQSYAVAV